MEGEWSIESLCIGKESVVNWKTIKDRYATRTIEEAMEIVELLDEGVYPGYSFNENDREQMKKDEQEWNEYLGTHLPTIDRLEEGKRYHVIVRSGYVYWPDYQGGTLYDLTVRLSSGTKATVLEVFVSQLSNLSIGDIVDLEFEDDRWFFNPLNDGGILSCGGGGHTILIEIED